MPKKGTFWNELSKTEFDMFALKLSVAQGDFFCMIIFIHIYSLEEKNKLYFEVFCFWVSVGQLCKLSITETAS